MGRRGFIWKRGENGQWYMTEGGRQIPLGHDREEAEREFHRRKAEATKIEKSGATLESLADEFMDYIEREREPGTAHWYRRFLKSFLESAGKTTPAREIEPRHVTAWLAAHPPWGATTRHHVITAVKRLYAWGEREGLLDRNPLKRIEKPRAKRRETFITPEQADAIIASVKKVPFRNFLVALRETGCRPIEIRTLTIDHVNLDTGTWTVINKTRRFTGEKYRTIYLNKNMVEMSRHLMEGRSEGYVFRNTHGRPWQRAAIVQRFLRIQRDLKMGEEAIAYAFRHLYITDALEKGVPPATVAELVGHKSLDMIMRTYSKLKHRTDHLRDAAQMIRPADGPDDGPTKSA